LIDKTNSDKKLTLVVSTKLSIESYKALQAFANIVYQEKGINKPTISEFLRLIINHMVKEMTNKPGFSVLENQMR
jgi:hypothetical protein